MPIVVDDVIKQCVVYGLLDVVKANNVNKNSMFHVDIVDTCSVKQCT